MEDKPHIEIRGIEAKLYDLFLFIGTLGFYNKLIKTVISDLKLLPGEKILDMGAGTGSNALRMLKKINGKGEIVGIEIGKEMKKQFEKKARKNRGMKLVDMRIEEPLPFENEFTRVFISFVIHGFPQEKRVSILKNGFKALKPGGKIHIFDWGEFNLSNCGLFLKFFFNHLECPEAKDFIARDFKKVLLEIGFENLEEKLYAKQKIRLLTGIKPANSVYPT